LIARQNSSSGASTAVLSAAVEPPALLCRTCRPPNFSTVDRPLQAVGLGYICTNGDRAVAGQMRGFLARSGVDLGDRDLGAFAREQNRGGAADPGARAGDEGDLPVESIHLIRDISIPPISATKPGRTVSTRRLIASSLLAQHLFIAADLGLVLLAVRRTVKKASQM
jgi:hypothetical protein